MKYLNILIVIYSFHATAASANTQASDILLAKYQSEGAHDFDADRGKKNWIKEIKGSDNEIHSCSTCHGTDLSKTGKHNTTQKLIEPMSTRVNPDRFNDDKKIEKWFKRNCKDTWGRECTAQEKGDFLKYLLSH